MDTLKGYTEMVRRMLNHQNITVKLNSEYVKNTDKADLIYYTGPIDSYFEDQGLPRLEYRSLRFETSVVPGTHQECAVVNEPSPEVPYTRTVEYKWINKHAEGLPWSVIIREFSQPYTPGICEPYYPIPDRQNTELYKRYQELAQKEATRGVYFVGRLANYKYYNMDEAIAATLELFDQTS